jgi:DNA repair protein RadC
MKRHFTNAKMSDIPKQERPYEKCERFGCGSLSDAELLCVILRSGAEGVSALDMSRSILKSLGSAGIAQLHKVSMEDLLEIRGVGRVKALQIRCVAELSRRIAQAKIGAEDELVYNSPDVIGAYYMEEMRHESQEIALVLCLSSKGKLISRKVISRGNVNATILGPREIFIEALTHRAASIILLHNHPSGDPTPSEEDITVTKQIAQAGEMIGIPLTDHLVIGDRTFVSMRRMHILRAAS